MHIKPLLRLLALILVPALGACATTTTKPRAKAQPTATETEPDPMTTVATYRATRHIAMFYRLDLKRDNTHAPEVVDSMRRHEPRFRDCYVRQLKKSPQLRGQVVFSFQIAKGSGSMQGIERVGGTLSDPLLERCIKNRLAAVALNAPRNMRGTVAYQFDAMETASSR